MLEQEIASIIKFTLDSAGNPAPYYNEVKENFIVPSCYFPSPEIDTDGETFRTYRLHYTWFIKFFHKTTEDSYAMALRVLLALKGARNLVPLIGTDGKKTGDGLRINDPELKKVDSGVYQIKIEWNSRRPYNDPEYLYMQDYHIEGWSNPDIYLERKFTAEVLSEIESYVANYHTTEGKAGTYPPKK